jgi:hypothetical protein
VNWPDYDSLKRNNRYPDPSPKTGERILGSIQIQHTAVAAATLLKRLAGGARSMARDMRWSYLPPLMVYFAAGVSGFTGIIEAFFVGVAFVALSLLFGLGRVPMNEEIIFCGSPGSDVFLMLAWIAKEAPRNRKATYQEASR